MTVIPGNGITQSPMLATKLMLQTIISRVKRLQYYVGAAQVSVILPAYVTFTLNNLRAKSDQVARVFVVTK